MGILARLFLLVVIALAPVTAIQVHDELDYRQAREHELHVEALRLATLVGMEQVKEDCQAIAPPGVTPMSSRSVIAT